MNAYLNDHYAFEWGLALAAHARSDAARLENCQRDNDDLRDALLAEKAAGEKHLTAELELRQEAHALRQERDDFRAGLDEIRAILRQHGHTGQLADSVRAICTTLADNKRYITRLEREALERGATMGVNWTPKLTRAVDAPGELQQAG